MGPVLGIGAATCILLASDRMREPSQLVTHCAIKAKRSMRRHDAPTSKRMTATATQRQEHLRWMVTSRLVEERLRRLYRQGRVVGGVYLGLGQEAVAAAGGCCWRPGDVLAPLIRDMAAHLSCGESMANVLAYVSW